MFSFTNYVFPFRKEIFGTNYKVFLEMLLSLRYCLTQDKYFLWHEGYQGHEQHSLEEILSQGQITQLTYLHKQTK
jgi:hypothetical protein